MITVKPTSELVLRAMSLGITNFMAKPFVADDLVHHLSKLLEKISTA